MSTIHEGLIPPITFSGIPDEKFTAAGIKINRYMKTAADVKKTPASAPGDRWKRHWERHGKANT